MAISEGAQVSNECEDSIMLNRSKSPDIIGLIIQKPKVEEKGFQRIKQRKKSHGKKFIR